MRSMMAAMAPVVPDYGKLLEGVPRGAWVAITHDEQRVLAYAAEMSEVLRLAHERGEADPIVFRLPEASLTLLM